MNRCLFRELRRVQLSVVKSRCFSAVGDSIPINFKKSDTDPVIKPDEGYPDWLWELEQPKLYVLEQKKPSELTDQEARRYWKLIRKAKIKDSNMNAGI
mmetsp:Transcript_6539/g.8094  ORF Transcript_6539/g.8094 Transcript_6539/m.8094 type:complete len:98 (-) Transcript_6539:106-399(-)